MPTRSPRPCRECRTSLTKTRDGLCDPCRAQVNARYAARRQSIGKDDAFYHSPEWRRLRAEHLAIEPLCRRHLEKGDVVKGYGVNHIIPRSLGGRDSHDNLETLCKGCLTAADPRGVVARRR